MLKKDKKLEHGSSSTVDLQRLLGVSYQQVPLSRVKKLTAAVITIVAIILFISLSLNSAATSKDGTPNIAATSPTGDELSLKEAPKESSGIATSQRLQSNKKDSIPTSMRTQKTISSTKTTTITTHQPSITTHTVKQYMYTTKDSTLIPTTEMPTTTNIIAEHPSKLDHTDILPIPTRSSSDFVLAMNPSIPASINLDCRSCAVVTNSAELYHSNAGSVIDSSECVIRLNTAPTIGHEDDVGGKTTVRVVSQDNLGDLLHHVWHEPEEMNSIGYVILYGQQNYLCENCTFFKLFKKVSGEYLGDKFIRYTKTSKTNVQRNSYPTQVSLSTQFHAIDIMRNFCRNMRVFGVERNHPCLSDRSYRKNYWQRNEYITCDGRRQDIVNDIRRYRHEKNIYNEWSEKYNLEFLYP